MGGARNRVHLVTREGVEDWPEMSKAEVAAALVARIAEHFGAPKRDVEALGSQTGPAEPPAAAPEPSPLLPAEPSLEEPRSRGAAASDSALNIRPTR